MMRSLYSAISGLKNHQVKMDVIGDNIANVNTTGFKRSRVNFSTMLSQTMKGASGPTATQGGTNAIQIGLGSIIGSVDKMMTQGSVQTTGKDTDLTLQGSGFFVLNNNGQTVYTRAGGFGFDMDGNLIDPSTGAKVQGYIWPADDSTSPVWAGIGNIRFSLGDQLLVDGKLPVTPTTATEDFSANTSIVDSNLIGAGNVKISGLTQVPVGQTPGAGEFSFDPATGTITLNAVQANPLAVDYVPAAVLTGADGTATSFQLDHPPAPGAAVYVNGKAYTLGTSSSSLSATEYWVENSNGGYKLTLGTAPSATDTVGYEFVNQPHTLSSFSIDQSGVVTGVYSDGTTSVTHKIAQIAVARFANDAGLNHIGGSFYTATNNSGVASVGSAGQDGRATIVPGAIEMSNVDLSTEFTDMIVTQRGFQANSRVITVSDTLLQELIDLKR
jgi:flagellar hook protein FlgE